VNTCIPCAVACQGVSHKGGTTLPEVVAIASCNRKACLWLLTKCKLQYHAALASRFAVHPGAFLLHQPHKPSQAQVAWAASHTQQHAGEAPAPLQVEALAVTPHRGTSPFTRVRRVGSIAAHAGNQAYI
jgi:hypothetical protein